MSKLKTIFAFSLGAAVGSVVTWRVLKPKYEQMAQKDVNDVKEYYKKLYSVNEPEEAIIVDKKEVAEATEIVEKLGYSTFTKEKKGVDVKDEKPLSPYVISPDEFDEIGYETSSLTYYADGVLVDESDNVIEDVDGLIGLDSLETFGRYEDDSVFVRNDDIQTDFEILRDERCYKAASPNSNSSNDE